MEDITKELNSATQYLRVMKRTGNHKEDCDNVLMHLANIEDLVKKLFIANVMQQRELLVAFLEMLENTPQVEIPLNVGLVAVDEYLATNCA